MQTLHRIIQRLHPQFPGGAVDPEYQFHFEEDDFAMLRVEVTPIPPAGPLPKVISLTVWGRFLDADRNIHQPLAIIDVCARTSVKGDALGTIARDGSGIKSWLYVMTAFTPDDGRERFQLLWRNRCDRHLEEVQRRLEPRRFALHWDKIIADQAWLNVR